MEDLLEDERGGEGEVREGGVRMGFAEETEAMFFSVCWSLQVQRLLGEREVVL